MVWPTVPGTGGLTIEGEFTVASAHNILVGESADVASGQNVLALGNVVTAPSSLGGLNTGVVYVQSGALMFMGASGTVTSLAAP